MTARDVPPAARGLAARLSERFDRDQQLALELNAAASQLRSANQQLWNGLHPDALALVYDEQAPAGGVPAEFISRSGVLPFDAEVPLDRTDILSALQQIHWAIQSAFADYQRIAEERRQLAADIGELTARLVVAMTTAGFSEHEARDADVSALGAGVLSVKS